MLRVQSVASWGCLWPLGGWVCLPSSSTSEAQSCTYLSPSPMGWGAPGGQVWTQGGTAGSAVPVLPRLPFSAASPRPGVG